MCVAVIFQGKRLGLYGEFTEALAHLRNDPLKYPAGAEFIRCPDGAVLARAAKSYDAWVEAFLAAKEKVDHGVLTGGSDNLAVGETPGREEE